MIVPDLPGILFADGKTRCWKDCAFGCFFCFASYKILTNRT